MTSFNATPSKLDSGWQKKQRFDPMSLRVEREAAFAKMRALAGAPPAPEKRSKESKAQQYRDAYSAPVVKRDASPNGEVVLSFLSARPGAGGGGGEGVRRAPELINPYFEIVEVPSEPEIKEYTCALPPRLQRSPDPRWIDGAGYHQKSFGTYEDAWLSERRDAFLSWLSTDVEEILREMDEAYGVQVSLASTILWPTSTSA